MDYSESKIHFSERKPFQKRLKVNARILTKINYNNTIHIDTGPIYS